MPDREFEVVIVGGGIIGTAVAYHLAKRGLTDVAILEREDALGLGSTAKAAGGIRAQFGSDINIELSRLSIEEFERFPEEMDWEVVFNQVGYLWMASREEEMAVFRKNVEKQHAHGVETRILTREEIAEIAPYVETGDLVGGTFHAKDGYAPPADYVTGYAKRAKERGVAILTSIEATGIGDGVVRTPEGEIGAKTVICAAGAWSGKFGEMAGVDVPIEPVRRQCFVTKPLPKLPHPIPMTVDYTSGVYIHSESGGVLVGRADPDEPSSFNENFDQEFLETVVEHAMHRVPDLQEAEILTGWGGLYENTPDHHPIIGPVPGRPGLWVVSGFSGHGVMHAPAAGRLVAEWIVDGRPSLDLSCLRLSRFREKALIRETHVI